MTSSPARMSRNEKRILVGLWMGCEFGRDVLSGIRDGVAGMGLEWRIRFSNTSPSFENAARWMIRERKIDGAISCFEDVPGSVRTMRQASFPVVWLSRERPAAAPKRVRGRTAFVALDTAAVVREAVAHFRARTGFRSFGFVDSHWDEGWSRLRGDLCLRELARQGLSATRFCGSAARSPRRAAGPDFDALGAYLRSLPKPAAVLVANDATAVDVVEACAEAGVSVPKEAAVLGMDDDTAYCCNAVPNISSVRFDGHGAGMLCVEALAGMLRGEPAPPEPLLYGVSAVVQRTSTGAVSTAGTLVQKALDFIDENFRRGISLGDVVRHLGVSRPLVTLRFRELLGKSVGDAIRERRLAEAGRLLRKTDLTIEEVSEKCGFGAVGAFRRCVEGAEGVTPAVWRSRLRRLAR